MDAVSQPAAIQKAKEQTMKTFAVYPSDDGSRESCSVFYSRYVYANNAEQAMVLVIDEIQREHMERGWRFNSAEFREQNGVEEIRFINEIH